MQRRQRVDEHFADAARERGIVAKTFRQIAPDRDTAFAFLYDEVDVADAAVGTQLITARRERKSAIELREHGVFAPHVVRAFRNRPERRPAQHVLVVAERYEIR